MPLRPGRFRWRLLGAACLMGALAACGASSPSPTTAETVPVPSAAPSSAPPPAPSAPPTTATPEINTEASTTTTGPSSETELSAREPEINNGPSVATTGPNVVATTAAATTGTGPSPPETTAATTGPATAATNPPPPTSEAPPTTAASAPATSPTTTEPTTTSAAEPPAEPDPPRRYLPQVVERLPHDRTSFTQGLVWRQGLFYESSGLYGSSAVRIVDPATGGVIREQTLPEQYFGEGLEVADGRVVQLTWQEETAFIWEADTLEPLGTYAYRGEGWGLCAQEDRFVMSDGSSVLTFRHLETFQPLGTVEVTRDGQPVSNLNELECANGLVYANIWLTDSIAAIDPADGTVTALIDGSGLADLLADREGINVLNGIAYRPDRNLFYLTGKLWPNLFLVELVPHP